MPPSQGGKTKKSENGNSIFRIFGRGDGIRTHDLLVPNQARYQLRYASVLGRYFFATPHKRIYYNK